MIRSVRLAPRAEADVEKIAMWIAEQGSPLSALQYVGRIRKFLEEMAEFPERGTAFDIANAGRRVVGFERRAQIAFVVRSDWVEIERVFYGGQDWQDALRSSKRRR